MIALLTGGTACVSLEAKRDYRAGAVQYDVLLAPDLKLGGCAAGDLVPITRGEEIAITDASGRVHVMYARDKELASEVVLESPGELIQCAVGRWGNDSPAIFAVGVAQGGEDDGGAGVLRRVWYDRSGEWRSQVLLNDPELLHAVALGDVDAGLAGDELVAAGFSGRIYVLRRTSAPEVIGVVPGNVKGLAVGAGGIVIACDDGKLLRFERDATGWTSSVLAKLDTPLARVDADPARVLVSTNDGRLLRWAEGQYTLLHREDDRLRGAVFLDGLAGLPEWAAGYEAATAGYSGVVSLVREDGSSLPLGGHQSRFHHLCLVDLPPFGGPTLVAVGFAGRVILLPLAP